MGRIVRTLCHVKLGVGIVLDRYLAWRNLTTTPAFMKLWLALALVIAHLILSFDSWSLSLEWRRTLESTCCSIGSPLLRLKASPIHFGYTIIIGHAYLSIVLIGLSTYHLV